jgi:hypothetical protein
LPLVEDGVVELPAGSLLIEASGLTDPTTVRLDGRHLELALDESSGRGVAAVDLARATGYHELALGPQRRYLFATSDAKLRLEGVVEMLSYLREEGLAWSGAMFFSGTDLVVRDRRLDKAWLESHGPSIVDLARRIAERPAELRGSRRRRRSHGVPDIGATMRLLRRQPGLLERHAAGPVAFRGEKWAPRELVVRERTRLFDTPGNRRTTALVDSAAALADSVLGALPPVERTHFGELRSELHGCLGLEPFRSLHRARAHRRRGVQRGPEELADERYGQVAALLEELERERSWSPQQAVASDRAYALYADQIYQRFVSIVLAEALGLKRLGDLLGPGPHFQAGDRFLYVDAKPPQTVLRDWRDNTDRRAALRPDLVLFDRATGKAAVLDAKYRQDGDRASNSSLAEVQLYLQAYGLSQVAVVFPPHSPHAPWAPAEVAAEGFRIFELPVRPSSGLATYLAAEVVPRIEAMLG